MLGNVNDDVKVACRASADAAFALTHDAQTRTCFHSGGNFYFQVLCAFNASFAMAIETFALDDLPAAASP